MTRRAPKSSNPRPLSTPERARQPSEVGSGAELGWLTLIIAGLALRLLIAGASIGSNDAVLFWNFAHQIQSKGLIHTYRVNAEFNHPPLGGLWAVTALSISSAYIGPIPDTAENRTMADVTALFHYSFVLKLPCLLADSLACCLLYLIWKKRNGARRGLQAAALYAWSLPALLISGYHGNTDSVFAVLSVLSVYLMQSRSMPFLSGLALGAAINVKLIPVLLIPGFFAGMKSRSQVIWFFIALVLCALPFVPVLLEIGPDFYRNALAYKSNINRWGLMLPWTWADPHPFTRQDDGVLMAFRDYGRYLLFALVLIWSVIAARVWKRPLYEVAAGAYAIFLVFASGFGVQYLVIVAPLLCAVSLWWSAAHSICAGLFLIIVYAQAREEGYPFASLLLGYFSRGAALIGLAAWLTLAAFLVSLIRGRSNTITPAPT